MARSDRKKYGVLYDLIDHENAGKNKSIFHTYKPKNEVGKEIFKELYKRFQSDPAQGRTGFYMDDAQEIGILSQCQSLQALLSLAADFGLTFDDKHLMGEDTENLTIREIMDMVIEDVIDRIQTKTPHVYKFDASPYETKLFTAEYSNVEAITWVIPCFLQALKYHAHIGETCKWEDQLIDVISYGLRYINDSFIEGEREGSSEQLTIGWNFTKDCQEPSLYYTFTVCECFVDFFTTFEELLSYREAERDYELFHIAIPKEKTNKYRRHAEVYQQLVEKGDPGYDENTGKKLAQFDEYNELLLRYRAINNGSDKIEGTLYGEMESRCKRVAKEIWRLSKNSLADEFFYNDLHTTLSEADIGMATTSDALFNTVYIINILLDAGVDEDLRKKLEVAESDEEITKAEQEYNNLFEACQMASQKAFRTYEKLKNTGKEYIVEQFLVGFNENFTTHKDLVKDLRKRRMRVFTLMPLLIRTNNVISEYLVEYPQINMRKYLGYILENRYEDRRVFKWIWEKDGFFSCSNYYYISALGEFYAYYEKYESQYIQNYTENENQRAAILQEQEEEMKAPTGEIGKLKREVQDRDKEIAALREELENVSTPVEDAVVAVAAEEMKRLFPEMLCDFVRTAAKGITVSSMDETPCEPAHTAFADAMSSFVLALLSERIHSFTHSGKLSKTEFAERYTQLEGQVKEDFSQLLNDYISEIKNSPEHRSAFFDKD